MAVQRVTSAPRDDIGDFALARSKRHEAARALTMSERLARAHALCKQMSALKGAAARH